MHKCEFTWTTQEQGENKQKDHFLFGSFVVQYCLFHLLYSKKFKVSNLNLDMSASRSPSLKDLWLVVGCT